jgi:hypothetical protein
MTNATRCFFHVKAELTKAASLKDLNRAAMEIQKVGGFDNQNRLGKIYKVKAAEFKR